MLLVTPALPFGFQFGCCRLHSLRRSGRCQVLKSGVRRRRLAFVLALFAVLFALTLVQPAVAEPAEPIASVPENEGPVDTSELSKQLKDAFGSRGSTKAKARKRGEDDSLVGGDSGGTDEDHVFSRVGEESRPDGKNATSTLEQRTGKNKKDTEEMRNKLEALRKDLAKNSTRASEVVEDKLSKLRNKIESRAGKGAREYGKGNLRGGVEDDASDGDVKADLDELEKAIEEGKSEQKKAIDALNQIEEKMADIVSQVNGTVRDVDSKEGILRKKEEEIDSLKHQIEQNILLDKVASVVENEGAKVNYDTGDITTANGTMHLDDETKQSLLHKAKEVDKVVRAITNDPAALSHDNGILMGFVAILCAATFGGIVANALGLPQTAGYIFAGMILGPSVLGAIDTLSSVITFAQFGSIFLLFDHGAAYPIKQLNQHRKSALMSTLATALILTVGYAVTNAAFFGVLHGETTSKNEPDFVIRKAIEGAVTGVAVSFSSFSVALLQHTRGGISTLHRGHAISIDSMTEDHVVLGSLQEKRKTRQSSTSTHAQIAMSVLAMQELLMGVVLTFMQRRQVMSWLGFFIVILRIACFGLIILAFDRIVVPALLHAVSVESYNGAFADVICGKGVRKFLGFMQAKSLKDTNFLGIDSIPAWSKNRKEIFILGIVSISLLLSVFSQACGLSLEAGALISGLLFSKCNHGEKVSGLMDSLTQFFASMGLVVSPTFIMQHFSIVMFYIIQLLVFKLVVNALVIKVCAHVSLFSATRAAMMLTGISELSLVLVNRAESLGLVTREVYLQILSSAVIAMVVIPIFLKVIGESMMHRDDQGANRGVAAFQDRFGGGIWELTVSSGGSRGRDGKRQ